MFSAHALGLSSKKQLFTLFFDYRSTVAMLYVGGGGAIEPFSRDIFQDMLEVAIQQKCVFKIPLTDVENKYPWLNPISLSSQRNHSVVLTTVRILEGCEIRRGRGPGGSSGIPYDGY